MQGATGILHIAEVLLHLRIVHIDTLAVAGDNLIVGRIEHHRTRRMQEVLSETVILIPHIEQREQRRHHIHLLGKSVVAHRGHTGTEHDERYVDGLKTNGYWMNVIQTWDEEGVDINTDYEKLVNALTPASVAKYVKDNFIGKNSVSVIMLPQE